MYLGLPLNWNDLELLIFLLLPLWIAGVIMSGLYSAWGSNSELRVHAKLALYPLSSTVNSTVGSYMRVPRKMSWEEVFCFVHFVNTGPSLPFHCVLHIVVLALHSGPCFPTWAL